MLALSLKVVRAVILSAMTIGFGTFAIWAGAEPTVMGTLTMLAVLGITGFEYSDWTAFRHALEEFNDVRDT